MRVVAGGGKEESGLISRRSVLAGMGLGLPLLAGCGRRDADAADPANYPSRDITLIIPNGAGGGVDVNARFVGNAMERSLPNRVNIVPMNIASGGGGKGVTRLFRARPDGYTIGILNVPGIFVLQHLRHMPYDFGRFAWFGTVTLGETYGIGVRADSPIRTYEDLVALSRRRAVTFAATGPEGGSYLVTTIAAQLLGLNARVVTGYKSSTDYIVGAMRGDTDAVIAALTNLRRLPGALRLLATFEAQGTTPGIPDATQLGQPELTTLMNMRVLAAPPETPPHIVSTLSQALGRAAVDERFVNWARRNQEEIRVRSPEETARLVGERRALVERWYR